MVLRDGDSGASYSIKGGDDASIKSSAALEENTLANAARANDALFYPINPGREEESWERFYGDAVHKFLAGDYAGDYEAKLIAEFDALLPEVPPWAT